MQHSSNTYPKQSEYPDWHYQPIRLLKQEMTNPLAVVEAFFSGYTLPQARKHFKEMLEDAMCNVEVYAINYITFYDSVEKLIEAAWLLKEQSKREAVTAEHKNTLQAILSMLISTIHPERIFLLSCEEGVSIDLLLVVSGSANKPFSHYSTLIETACYAIPSVSFSLHESATFQRYLEEGYPFWLSVCTPEKQVYSSGTSAFPQPATAKREEWKEKVWRIFQDGMAKGGSFLDRAKECLEEKNNGLALFMLHQAAELPLRALIRSLTGHEIKEHNLANLLKHLRRCAPAVTKVFLNDTEEEKAVLALLESGYRKGRYNDDFTVSREVILSLSQRVYGLQEACEEAFTAIVDSVTKSSAQAGKD